MLRNQTVDIAKGISIFLVVFSHSDLALYLPELNDFFRTYRMPLFFFLSGIFFSYRVDFSKFFIKKTDAILKPYFFTLFVVLFLWFMLGKVESWPTQLLGIFWGVGSSILWTPLWFLSHLWLLYVFSYLFFSLVKLDDMSNLMKCIFVMVSFFVGAFFLDFFWSLPPLDNSQKNHFSGLPFSADIIFLSMSFFSAGYLLKRIVLEFRFNMLLFLSLLASSVALFIIFEPYLDLDSRKISQPLVVLFLAYSGIYSILSISTLINKVEIPRKIFASLGAGSLFILVFHSFIENKSLKLIRVFDVLSAEYEALLAFLIGVFAPLIVRYIVLQIKPLSLMYTPAVSYK